MNKFWIPRKLFPAYSFKLITASKEHLSLFCTLHASKILLCKLNVCCALYRQVSEQQKYFPAVQLKPKQYKSGETTDDTALVQLRIFPWRSLDVPTETEWILLYYGRGPSIWPCFSYQYCRLLWNCKVLYSLVVLAVTKIISINITNSK